MNWRATTVPSNFSSRASAASPSHGSNQIRTDTAASHATIDRPTRSPLVNPFCLGFPCERKPSAIVAEFELMVRLLSVSQSVCDASVRRPMSAAISASCCGRIGRRRVRRTNRTPRRCLVYAVTYPRSAIAIDEQRIQGIHDIVVQRPSPARFVGASLECRQPQSSRGRRGRPANLMDPLAQDACHRHEDVENHLRKGGDARSSAVHYSWQCHASPS